MRTLLALLVVACSSSKPAAVAPSAHLPDAELAESVPLETTLDHDWVKNAPDVWLDMIRGATRSIDIAEFYISDEPGSKMRAVLDEIERQAHQGVHVRVLLDSSFSAKYPETAAAWSTLPNMEVRTLDFSPGVMHAKYFIVDGREAYVGSQNFDWRSLEHIVEMGVRVRTPRVVAALGAVFRGDWDKREIEATPIEDKIDGGAILFGASPKKAVPESMWDLPRLLSWIGATTGTLRVSVLTYKITTRHGGEFHDLDDAVRAAAKRGVHVQLIVSTWNEKDDAVTSLARVANVEVRTLDIPKLAGRDIPFARVTHAKYALFDDARAWVGTSNWEGDYFFQSRNVGLFFEHGSVPGELARTFAAVWSSTYARPL